MAAREYKLILKTHSIIFDAWSIDLFWRELFSLYRKYNSGKIPVKLAPLPVNYKDYAEWQNSRAFKQIADRQHKFWAKELSGGKTILNLPFDKQPKDFPNIDRVESAFKILERGMVRDINKLCSKYKSNHFAFFLAVFSIFLNKITKHTDIILDNFMSNRVFPELEGMIGPVYNHVPIRKKIDKNQSFLEYLSETGDSILNFKSNNFFYDYHLIENLNSGRRSPKGPLFNVSFSANQLGIYKKTKKPRKLDLDISHDIGSYKNYMSSHDLSFNAFYSEETIKLALIYKKSLFKRKTVDIFLAQIVNIMTNAINNKNIKIKDIK